MNIFFYYYFDTMKLLKYNLDIINFLLKNIRVFLTLNNLDNCLYKGIMYVNCNTHLISIIIRVFPWLITPVYIIFFLVFALQFYAY